MSKELEAFKKLQAILARQRERSHLVPVADPGHVKALEASGTDQGRDRLLRMVISDDLPDAVETDSEAMRVLAEVQRTVHSGRIDEVVTASRRAVIDAVVRPFGLGRLVARADRRGGSVLTLHNAEVAREEGWQRAGEIADQDKLNSFRDRMGADFDRSKYDVDPERKTDVLATATEDAYTGMPLGEHVNVDHVISARELHGTGDAGNGVPERPDIAFHLTEEQLVEFATSDANLAATDEGLNKSKKARPITDWMDQRRDDGPTNAEKYGVDRERAAARDAKARTHLKRRQQVAAAKHYAAGIATCGAKEAARMGFQQAVGLLLVEVVDGLFDEVASYLRDRPKLDGMLIPRLRASLESVAGRVVAKWKEALVAFRDGAISGFISNLVTVLLNMVVTTSKRVVRILREGVFSLGRAVRLVLAPPPNVTPAHAMHEASKLLATGTMVAAGVTAEEFVEKAVTSIPVLALVAEPLTVIIVGVGTGLATVLLAYLLDEADVFGVRRDGEAKQVDSLLDDRLDLAALRLAAKLNDPVFDELA